MTQAEFKALLDGVGIQFSYDHSPIGSTVPYGSYTWLDVSALNADDRVFCKKTEVSVKLVTDSKESANLYGRLIENVLDNISPWSVSEGYLDSEKIYERNYTMEV